MRDALARCSGLRVSPATLQFDCPIYRTGLIFSGVLAIAIEARRYRHVSLTSCSHDRNIIDLDHQPESI